MRPHLEIAIKNVGLKRQAVKGLGDDRMRRRCGFRCVFHDVMLGLNSLALGIV